VDGQGQIDYWKAEVIRERKIFMKLMCAILDGGFHIEYLNCLLKNYGNSLKICQVFGLSHVEHILL
jgi:hypothetical protein